VRIHGYFIRKVRDAETKENVEITIFAIFCAIARERRDQYTKRILPPFVTPECNIMLCSVMAYLAQYPQKRINYGEAAEILGAMDDRTIRKHILEGREVIDQTTLELTGVLSEQSGFARIPELKPGLGVNERLGTTVDGIDATVTRMRGAAGEQAPAIVYVHAVYTFHRVRKCGKNSENFGLKISLNRVLSGIAFDDTS